MSLNLAFLSIVYNGFFGKYKNTDENVHRYAVLRVKLRKRERKSKRERETERERERERERKRKRDTMQ